MHAHTHTHACSHSHACTLSLTRMHALTHTHACTNYIKSFPSLQLCIPNHVHTVYHSLPPPISLLPPLLPPSPLFLFLPPPPSSLFLPCPSSLPLLSSHTPAFRIWLYNLCRGTDEEPLRLRHLPKSISCGKNFNGPEIITATEKVRYEHFHKQTFGTHPAHSFHC